VKRETIHALGLVVLLGSSLAADSAEDAPPPLPADPPPRTESRDVQGRCLDCAVIRRIRNVERERPASREIPSYMTSDQYLDTRRYSEPRVGPVFGMTFGAGQETRTFVGAAGTSTMRQRMLEIVYEVTVRYDDGRFGRVEMNDATGFRVNDRVRVVNNQLELLPREQ
jgi:hypothetical protein